MSSYPDQTVIIQEHHIHGFLGYFTVAAAVLTIGSTIALLLNQYNLASRSLSTRQGVQRKRLLQLFLGLAVICFVVVTVLKYAGYEARQEVGEMIAGAHGGGQMGKEESHGKRDREKWEELREAHAQIEVPSPGPERRYIAVKRSTELSDWLNKYTPFNFGGSIDAGNVLAKWLPPFDNPTDYWWSSEYYWGALVWFYFLSYETRVRALPWSAPVLLTLLSGYISLSGSQCLLYAMMLMSPVRDNLMERWTPYQAPLVVPFWLHAAAWTLLPSASAWTGAPIVVFATGAMTYAAFTAITWIHPHRLGKFHSTAAAAKRSRAVTLAIMTLPLVAIRIFAATHSLLQVAAELGSKVGSKVVHLNAGQAMEEAAEDMKEATLRTFGMLGDTGRVNAMAWDVVLSTIVVALWLAYAEADPNTMLRSTLLPWLRDEDEVAYELQKRNAAIGKKTQSWLDSVKQLTSVKSLTRFARLDEGPTTGTAETYVRKRGRPPKHRKSASSNESGYAVARSKSKSRSPGRPRKSVSPSKQASTRTRSQSRARSQVPRGQYGWRHASSLEISVAGGEAAGVVWSLVLLGGLGVVMLAAFGVEATELI